MGNQCRTITTSQQLQIVKNSYGHRGVMRKSRLPFRVQSKTKIDFEKDLQEEGTDFDFQFEQASQDGQNSLQFDCYSVKTNRNILDKRSKKKIYIKFTKEEQFVVDDNVNFLDEKISQEHLNFINSALSNHCIFCQLSVQQREYLPTQMRYCKSKQGSYIFKQGDISGFFYILISGKCEVQIDGQKKTILSEGEYFGDLGVMYSTTRTASILSITQCLLAEMSNVVFRNVLEDLNIIQEKQNRKYLQKVDFYQELDELQKNVLAASCNTQIYQPEQIIFRQGDEGNSLYIIKQGIVTFVEKGVDLEENEHFGLHSILTNAKVYRLNTVRAKTKCKLLSLTRGVIINSLGSDIGQIMRQNLVFKIVKQSRISKMFSLDQWTRSITKMTTKTIHKNDIVFQKGTCLEILKIAIILNTEVASNHFCYKSNSIIEQSMILGKSQIIFHENFYSNGEGYCIFLDMTQEKTRSQIHRSNSGNKKSLDGSFSRQEKVSLSLKDFIVIKKLRSGNYGKVYACYNKKTQEKYAIKVINKSTVAAANLTSYVKKQEQLLRTLPEHPFIVKSHAVFFNQNFYMIVMDLLQGEDMYEAISPLMPLSTDVTRFLVSQVLLMLEHLHFNKVIYRDLKPQNLVLGQDGYLTLVDMGTAKRLDIQSRFKTHTIIGTPHYMAPQIILGKGYTFSSDYWSLGIIMFELLTGQLPFGQSVDDPLQVYQLILQKQLSYTFSNNIHMDCKYVLSKLLVKSAEKRIQNGIEQLKNLPFFQNLNFNQLLHKGYKATIFPDQSSKILEEEIIQKISKKHMSAFQVFLKEKQHSFSMMQID